MSCDFDCDNVEVLIGQESYLISAKIPVSSWSEYFGVLRKGEDPRRAFAALINSILVRRGVPSMNNDFILSHWNSTFDDYMMAIIRCEPGLNDYFERTESLADKAERFAMAAGDYLKNLASINLNSYFENLNHSIKLTVDVILNYGDDAASRIVNTVYENLVRFSDVSQILGISDERYVTMKNAYESWGKIGWTLPPNAPVCLFSTVPPCSQKANEVMLKYCKTSDMEVVFDELKKNLGNVYDLSEAIGCYKETYFKACALILFSIIDSKIITIVNDKNQHNKTKRSEVGMSAICHFENDIDVKFVVNSDRTKFLPLLHLNLFSCLKTFFSSANFFIEDPPVINRNFLAHGMNKRRVNQEDCIKLFVALNNLLDFISVVEPLS